MEYVTYVLGWSVLTYRVGNTGLKISKIILGCMSFGDKRWIDWILDEEEALPLLLYAYQRGINTWDTADVYSYGRSEEIVGKALKKVQHSSQACSHLVQVLLRTRKRLCRIGDGPQE